MKTRLWLMLIGFLIFPCVIFAGTLSIPSNGQEQSNWCWDATSQMILNFYGFDVTQSAIAAWAVNGNNHGSHLSGTPVLETSVDPPYIRQGITSVLKNFGPVPSSYLARSLHLMKLNLK